MGNEKFAEFKKAPGAFIKKFFKSIKVFWKTPPKGRFLNLREIVCFAGANLGVSFMAFIMYTYITIQTLPKIYRMGEFGSFHATLIALFANVLGLILTPIYGRMMQNTKTKYGRYKPYLLLMTPLVAVLGVASVWAPQDLSQTGRIIYAYCLSIPALAIYNLWYNAFNLFPGVITPNAQERIDIWSPIGLVIGFAPTVMGVVMPIAVGYIGELQAARLFSIICMVIGILCVSMLLSVKERVYVTDTEDKQEKIGVLKSFKMVLKNKPLIILTLAMIFGSLRSTIDFTWGYIMNVKYAPDMANASIVAGSLALIVGFAATPNMILLPFLTRKFNNKNILIGWQLLNVIGCVILGAIGFQNMPQGGWAIGVICFARFLTACNAIGSLIPMMVTEICDLQQAQTGYRLEGFVQTIIYTFAGLIQTLLMLIPALIQAKVGFIPEDFLVHPPEEAALNILSTSKLATADHYFNIVIWISVASSLAYILCLCFYTLSKKKHNEIIKQLENTSVNTEDVLKDKSEGISKELDKEEHLNVISQNVDIVNVELEKQIVDDIVLEEKDKSPEDNIVIEEPIEEVKEEQQETTENTVENKNE